MGTSSQYRDQEILYANDPVSAQRERVYSSDKKNATMIATRFYKIWETL